MQVLSFVLYALLGALLTFAGVSVLDRPIMFLAIMTMVGAIDIVSGLRS
jgi:hypothetical protein